MISQKIHPQTIISGWRKATDVARKALEDSAIDNSNDRVSFRADLLNIAKTTLSSKILQQHKDLYANLAVDAVLRLKGKCNLDAIQIIKKLGSSLADSYLDEGIFYSDKNIFSLI